MTNIIVLERLRNYFSRTNFLTEYNEWYQTQGQTLAPRNLLAYPISGTSTVEFPDKKNNYENS